MRLRTIALALTLACGFTAVGEAKKHIIRPAAKSSKVKRKAFKKNHKVRHHKPKARR